MSKISLSRVQEAFNSAIKKRDGICRVRDFSPCCGSLECSHYFSVGAYPTLRFYPKNAYAQCACHHRLHHSGKKFYTEWIQEQPFFEKMSAMKNRYIKYTEELKAMIITLCNSGRLDELAELIEKEIE